MRSGSRVRLLGWFRRLLKPWPRNLRRRNAWALSTAGALLIGLLALASCASPPNVNAPLSPVDDHIFRWMMRATTDEAHSLPWVLMPVSPGFDPDSHRGQERSFLERFRALHLAIVELQSEEHTARIFREINVSLVATLGVSPRAREVRHRAYAELLRRGLLSAAVARANRNGSSPAPVIPPGFRPADDVDAETPGVIAAVVLPAKVFKCTSILWYCPTGGRISRIGSLTTKGGALTVTDFGNPELRSCVLRYRQLLSSDPVFAQLNRHVLEPLIEESRFVDPADPAAIAEFMKRVYDEAESSGLAQRIDTTIQLGRERRN